MVKRNYNMPDDEPEQSKFEIPSPIEHLFTVSDILENIDPDPNVVHVKCEVTGGSEEGRTLLNRLNLDENEKSFFAVRLFLKAISLPHKGQVEIDTDNFQARQFYATVKHSKSKDGTKVYANIEAYNFDKIVEEVDTKPDSVKPVDEEVEWDS